MTRVPFVSTRGARAGAAGVRRGAAGDVAAVFAVSRVVRAGDGFAPVFVFAAGAFRAGFFRTVFVRVCGVLAAFAVLAVFLACAARAGGAGARVATLAGAGAGGTATSSAGADAEGSAAAGAEGEGPAGASDR